MSGAAPDPTRPTPTLSVVVLNYNYARYLPACLKSILGQTFRDFEVVVVDDRSTDDSRDVVVPFLSDSRVRLHPNTTNMGFCKSLIAGTEELTRGEFVTVISADDLVQRPDAFERQMALLRAHPETAFCFSAIDLVRGESVVGEHHSFNSETVMGSREALHALLLRGTVWPLHSGTIIRRSAYERAGGYRRDIAIVLDLAMWLPLTMEGGFAYVPERLYGYRLHEGQMSVATAKIRANAREVGRVLTDACLLGQQRGFDTGPLVDTVIGVHLSNTAINEAFTGNRKVALQRWYAAIREWPAATAKSRKLWIIAFRATFGDLATKGASESLRVVKRWLRRPGAEAGPSS